jgi:predicted nucleic acid-binding protein
VDTGSRIKTLLRRNWLRRAGFPGYVRPFVAGLTELVNKKPCATHGAFFVCIRASDSYNDGMVKPSDKTIRIYADTSVFGGVFDEEFEAASKAFFNAVKKAKFVLVTSDLVRQEILAGPENVQKLFYDILTIAEVAEISAESLKLQRAYTDAGIVPERYSTDALHVALATTSQASLIVSWNFKHIVNFQKIPLYNVVNTLHGYREIAIYSPSEVIEYED